MQTGKVVAVSLSRTKGTPKENVPQIELTPEWGVVGDAHGGDWHRQVSLLALESIEKMRDLIPQVKPGDFAENITTRGLDLPRLPVGTRLRIGPKVILQVTQIGKSCHTGCAIFQQVGQCIMPREGIFARVLRGGTLRSGDLIVVLEEGE
jgi:MOSC domain-containing protein YiiM